MKHLLLITVWFLFFLGFGLGGRAQYCVEGNCNTNSYVNSQDPNTIEYDNMVSVFHASIVREYDGKVLVWGEGIGERGANIAPPQELNSANYGSGSNQLSGTVLKFTAAGQAQFSVLTTEGLYVWGKGGFIVSQDIYNANSFSKVAIGTYNMNQEKTKADGLPMGVKPTDVKMMFGAVQGMAIVTCSGEAWILTQISEAQGDNAPDTMKNKALWHRVHTVSGAPLNEVVAVRGGYGVFMALTADGKIYTWGISTYLGDNSAVADRSLATEMSKPAGVKPKMIGMTTSALENTFDNIPHSYYLLATDGRLYALGDNSARQLGDGTTVNRSNWVQVRATQTISGKTYTLDDNIVWISPQEHDWIAKAINVITKEGQLWAWGDNLGGMLGGSQSLMNPTCMPGSKTRGSYDETKLNLSDKIMAVETGGHTTVTIKQCTTKFGYVGHRINGSMSDNIVDEGTELKYNYGNTNVLSICGAVSTPIVKNTKICKGTTFALSDAEPSSLPVGVIGIKWWLDAEATIPVLNSEAVPPGTYYATFTGLLATCPAPMTVSYYTDEEALSTSCDSYLITNPLVRQLMQKAENDNEIIENVISR